MDICIYGAVGARWGRKQTAARRQAKGKRHTQKTSTSGERPADAPPRGYPSTAAFSEPTVTGQAEAAKGPAGFMPCSLGAGPASSWEDRQGQLWPRSSMPPRPVRRHSHWRPRWHPPPPLLQALTPRPCLQAWPLPHGGSSVAARAAA